MKVALVHELLTRKGGAERVLRTLADMYPTTPIYTLLYNERKLGDWFPKERVRIAKFPPPFSLLPPPYRYNHHLYLPFFPRAVESWDFSEFDLVISSSSSFVHGIITNGKPKHLCYVQSPARYLWDRTHDVLERAGRGMFGPLRHAYLSRVFHKLRTWDTESADRSDRLLAASKTVQRRIELYWRRESTVVYPPIDDRWFSIDLKSQIPDPSPYFLVVSQLASYKHIERAIDACNATGVCLRIAGEGPAYRALKRRAGPTISFLGFVPEQELPSLYRGAIATVFPGEEDFGLVPLESMACGTPVIAYREGGALETILEGKTGAFFDETTPLPNVLRTFDRTRFREEDGQAQARLFSQSAFESAIRSAAESLVP